MAETSGTSTPKTRRKTGKPSTKKPAAAKKTSAAKAASTAKKTATAKSTAKKAAAGTKTAAKATPKTTVRKTSARKTTTKTAAPPLPFSAEERRRLIAEAAYLRAERRGFAGGDPVSDWLAAEADIDARLTGTTH